VRLHPTAARRLALAAVFTLAGPAGPLSLAPPAAPAHAAGAAEVARAAWTEVRTAHVQVLTDAGREVGERVATRMEELRAALAAATPALVVEVAPVQVLVFRDATLARAYAPRWRGLADDVAGYFHAGPDRRRVLFADDRGRTPSVAQHEYTHALLDAALSDAPLWLNEGLAEYFSTFRVEGGTPRSGGAIASHVEWLASHDLMPFAELFALDQSSPDYHEGDRRGTFYAQSWALAHLLLHGSRDGDDAGRLERVLFAARGGERFATAFRREFGSEEALRPRLHVLLERERFAERSWPHAAAGARTVRVRERFPAADVLASLGLGFLSRPTPQREDAGDHLRAALALDARHADACAGMGWLELQRGRRAEARAWFDRSLAAPVISPAAVRVIASQLLNDASQRQAHDEREEVGRYARRAVEAALAVAPEDPELLALAARAWVAWPGDDAEPGHALALRAVAALPGRSDVLLDRVALAAITGRDAEAAGLAERFLSPDAPPAHRRSARTALLAGDVRAANRLAARGDLAAAEARLRAARERVADDPELAREAGEALEHFARARVQQGETLRENRAIAEYNSGVKAGNARRFTEAAAAFRRAAEASARDTFRTEARRMARRMDARAQGERAVALARTGDTRGALALLEAIDRSALDPDERRWLDDNLAKLRSRR
jgi:tetratricopeptide (TPR) repeat protein